MSLILHIETATKICSVCLSEDQQILAEQYSEDAYSHAEQLTLFIEKCCQESQRSLRDIDAVSVNIGPGSYTGLRIGLSVAKGICYALQKPLLAINGLEALASSTNSDKDTFVMPMIDARRMEVYTALYKDGEEIKAAHAHILTEKEMEGLDDAAKILFVGEGGEKYKTICPYKKADFLATKSLASHQIMLANKALKNKTFSDVAYAIPLYLKPPNITKSSKNVLFS